MYNRYEALSNQKLYFTPRAMELQELMSLYSKDKMKSDSLYAIYQQLEKDGKIIYPSIDGVK